MTLGHRSCAVLMTALVIVLIAACTDDPAVVTPECTSTPRIVSFYGGLIVAQNQVMEFALTGGCEVVSRVAWTLSNTRVVRLIEATETSTYVVGLDTGRVMLTASPILHPEITASVLLEVKGGAFLGIVIEQSHSAR